VKLVVPVRLFPTPAQETALRDTLALCNHAANLTSREAFADWAAVSLPHAA
jgi:putative transposase